MRQQVDLVHMPGNPSTVCCEILTTHQLLSETLGPPSKVFFTVPSPNNNSRKPSRGLLGSTVTPSCFEHMVLMVASAVPPGTHTAFFSFKAAAAVPCGLAVTSLRPTMTSTTLIAISSFCLRTSALRPLCSKAWLRLRSYTQPFVADLPWTYSRFRSDILLHLVHEPVPHDPELFSF